MGAIVNTLNCFITFRKSLFLNQFSYAYGPDSVSSATELNHMYCFSHYDANCAILYTATDLARQCKFSHAKDSGMAILKTVQSHPSFIQ